MFRNIFWLFLASFACAAFIHINISHQPAYSPEAKLAAIAYKKKIAVGCSPDLSSFNFDDSANIIPLLNGWGKYRMPVTVINDSANIFFQQGINMYYGFHVIESLASFEKAVKFDSNFAMGYWGKALALGPNINDLGYVASPIATQAIQKAKILSINCSPVEKALINAMEMRYFNDTTQSRNTLNEWYADAMNKVHTAYPKSADAAALYADALMLLHPWDLYDRFYEPKSWTPKIVSILENLVNQFPDHPGANHYYIHAIEGSKQPAKALKVANRLGNLMPGLAHLVHMPSHIYIRSGDYNKGVEVNETAVKNYYENLAKYPLTLNNAFIYLVHNLHMKAACANMDSRYAASLKYSYETRNSFDSVWQDAGGYFGMYSQYLYMTPYFTQVRFGKWEDILNSPAIPETRVYANRMWHFGRGLAYARKHLFDLAAIEMQKMNDSLNSFQLQDHPLAFNPGIAAVQVASKILSGVIAEEREAFTQSIALFKQAVNQEDNMLYNEPKDWLLPARQYLGNVLLKAKQFKEAENVFREDLRIIPNNAWSLTGLEKALLKQGKKKAAIVVRQQLQQAQSRSDIKITGSVF